MFAIEEREERVFYNVNTSMLTQMERKIERERERRIQGISYLDKR